MTLLKLKQIVDLTISRLQGYQNPDYIPVLIELDEPSIGAGASSDVRWAGMGIDWEHGQFRLKAETHIIAESKSRSIPIPTVKEESGGMTFTACPKCRMKVAKDDGYCRHCGQRLL